MSGIYCFLWRPKVIWMLDFIIRRLFLWRHNVAKTLTSQSQNESIKVGIFSCFRILMLWFFKDLNGWLLSVHFQILRPWYYSLMQTCLHKNIRRKISINVNILIHLYNVLWPQMHTVRGLLRSDNLLWLNLYNYSWRILWIVNCSRWMRKFNVYWIGKIIFKEEEQYIYPVDFFL